MNFFTCAKVEEGWVLNAAVSIDYEEMVHGLIHDNFKGAKCSFQRAAILSLFPHNYNPRIPGALFDILQQDRDLPTALASSNSAISVLLPESVVNDIAEALFESFEFGAYEHRLIGSLLRRTKKNFTKRWLPHIRKKGSKSMFLNGILDMS